MYALCEFRINFFSFSLVGYRTKLPTIFFLFFFELINSHTILRLESELEAEKTKKMAAATTSTPSEREHELEKELGRVREKLGAINVKYADLKVDVDREELELQKRCKRLQVMRWTLF